MPSSPRRELTLPIKDLLPLSACMCSSINSNVFAVYHWRGLQIQHSVDNFRDLNQSRNRVKLLETLMIIVRMHRCVNSARGNRIDANPVGHELHRQLSAECRNGGLCD